MKPVMRLDSKIDPVRVIIRDRDGNDVTEKAADLTQRAANGDMGAANQLPVHSRDTTIEQIPNIQKLEYWNENSRTYTCHPSVWAQMPEKLKARYEVIDVDAEMESLLEST